MSEMKNVISKNLVKYRKAFKFTQIELGEKLLYSNKNISKWERGESIPDVLVLKQLADIYGITVNDFLVNDLNVFVNKNKIKNSTKKHLSLTFVSFSFTWLAVFLGYIFLNFSNLKDKIIFLFIIILPFSLIVLLDFNNAHKTDYINSFTQKNLHKIKNTNKRT